jgi:acetyl coenzyme A synthetase (ADP forming)-like protein
MSQISLLKSLNAAFNPKTVAVIGASGTPGKIGYIIFNNLIKGRFKGRVYPVNPNTKVILGRITYPSILDVPEEIDLAIIVVKAELVENVLQECIKAGVKVAVIISANFKEVGGEGLKREERLKEIINKSKIRVIGPNCMGIFDNYSGLDMLFLPETRMEKPKPGNISIISQSGAVMAIFLDWMAKENIGVAKGVSYGNRIDIDEADLIQYLAYDEETKVILVYIEGLDESKGKKFIQACKFTALQKPIIVVKGGKTEASSKAVMSHTGAMAGSYSVYKAAFKQAGVIEAENIQEMFDMAKALAMQPLPAGKNVAVISNTGGIGIMAVDALESRGLSIPELDEETKTYLRNNLPAGASVRNPVDLTANATAEHYRLAINKIANLDYIHSLVICLEFQTPQLDFEVLDYVYYAKELGKPIVTITVGGGLTERISRIIENNGIPSYTTPERAATGIYALYEYSRIKYSLI